MAYSPSHTGRHHHISHSWHDPMCEGCKAMTMAEEEAAQRQEAADMFAVIERLAKRWEDDDEYYPSPWPWWF